MRKMTKTAVTLAAMSAMTVASASMAFAAVKQESNISSIDNTTASVDSSASGTWGGDAVKGYTFTLSDTNTKLKNQWAEIDGIWYYFDGETIARNTFKVLDDKGYFFDESGRLATGWQKISSKMDAYGNIDIADALYNPYLNGYTPVDENHEYDYHDFVWCYFDEHGVAKENEWFQDPATDLWYYFDGNAMVKNVYDYIVIPDNHDAADSWDERRYGFDENGAMLVGWNYKKGATTYNDPTVDKDGKIWYYYKSNGQMQKAGWANIGDKWYLFADLNADKKDIGTSTNGVGTQDDIKWHIGGYPLIVNSYVASYPTRTATEPEYFYVNSKGELVSGVTDIKNAYKVVFYPEGSDGTINSIKVAYEVLETPKDKTISVNFSTYAAKEDIVNDRYYTMDIYDKGNAQIFKFNPADNNVGNYMYNATSVWTGNTISGSAWQFTDPGYVRFSNTTEAVTNAMAYTSLTRSVKDNIAATIIKDVEINSVTVAVPKVNNIEEDIKNVEAAKVAYQTIYDQYEAAKDAYINKINSVTCTPAVSGGQAGLNVSLNRTNAQRQVDLANKARENADIEYATYKPLLDAAIANGDETRKAVYQSKVDAAEAAQLAADEYKKNALAAQKEVEAAIVVSAKAERDAYEAAARKEETAWLNVEKAQSVVDGKRNFYVNEGNVNNGLNTNDFAVVGELVKNAFIGRKDDLYLADKNGDFIKNKAVLITTNANVVPVGGSNLRDVSVFNNGYILFDANGKALRGYETTKKSVTIGGVTYWSTGQTATCGKAKATVFVANKQYPSGSGKY